MKKLFLTAFAGALMLTACGTSEKTTEEAENSDMTPKELLGTWQIMNIVESDSSYIRPEGDEQTISFTSDSTFSVSTNCNILGGYYKLDGDKMTVGDALFSTMMYCPDSQVEDAMKQIMPQVTAVDFTNDSTVRLNTAQPERYIVLKKIAGATAADTIQESALE